MRAIICIKPRGACFKGQLSRCFYAVGENLSPGHDDTFETGFCRVPTRSFLLFLFVVDGPGHESRGVARRGKSREGSGESATKPRAVVDSTLADQRDATKYSLLAAVNGVVNDATSPSFVHARRHQLSRVAVTTALLLPVNYTLYSTRATTQPKANCIIER